MAEWTIEEVAYRFAEAVETGRRLPRVQVQGYFTIWPAFAQQVSTDDDGYRRLPPSPDALERMLETQRWVQWLEEEQRHLIWMRAKQYEWSDICKRFGCERTTAWRRWQRALGIVAARLNGKSAGNLPCIAEGVTAS